eukprot:1159402-Pelagomonas_calceolata.AAC.15
MSLGPCLELWADCICARTSQWHRKEQNQNFLPFIRSEQDDTASLSVVEMVGVLKKFEKEMFGAATTLNRSPQGTDLDGIRSRKLMDKSRSFLAF